MFVVEREVVVKAVVRVVRGKAAVVERAVAREEERKEVVVEKVVGEERKAVGRGGDHFGGFGDKFETQTV